MKVTSISASLRYSKVMPSGAWKAVELSAEASLSDQENWQKAQAALYEQLGRQLTTLWTTRVNGQASNANGQSEHYCAEHDVPFKRHEKEGRE